MDLRKQPCTRRLKGLYELLAVVGGGPIVPVPTASTPATKRALLARLRQEHREGIVFKRADSLYVPGRPASGGEQLKLKFTATASCLVAGTNGTRHSVALELLDGDRHVPVGNVTIPPRTAVPAAGQIVEIRYLYAYAGGSLYNRSILAHGRTFPPATAPSGN